MKFICTSKEPIPAIVAGIPIQLCAGTVATADTKGGIEYFTERPHQWEELYKHESEDGSSSSSKPKKTKTTKED